MLQCVAAEYMRLPLCNTPFIVRRLSGKKSLTNKTDFKSSSEFITFFKIQMNPAKMSQSVSFQQSHSAISGRTGTAW